MNTASQCDSLFFSVASSRTGLRFDTVEVWGSSPHVPTIFSPTCDDCLSLGNIWEQTGLSVPHLAGSSVRNQRRLTRHAHPHAVAIEPGIHKALAVQVRLA